MFCNLQALFARATFSDYCRCELTSLLIMMITSIFSKFFIKFFSNSIKDVASRAVLGALKAALLRAMTIQSEFSDEGKNEYKELKLMG